jgi:hypothetical protein
MIYAELNSFFDTETSSNKAKQLIINTIESDVQKGNLLMDVEYNIYQLIIRYNEKEVEIWDWIVSPDEAQEPCSISLDAFVQALKEYIPSK